MGNCQSEVRTIYYTNEAPAASSFHSRQPSCAPPSEPSGNQGKSDRIEDDYPDAP